MQTIRPPLIGRHVHERAYAALVVSGCYEEAGDFGRHRVQAGNVVLHEAFEAHLDRIPTSGAVVLNLSLPARYALRSGVGRVDDADTIVRLVEKGDSEAAALLLWSTKLTEPKFQDWPDELAATLARMRPSTFPVGAKQKEFQLGTYPAVLRRYSESPHPRFEHVLGRIRLGGRFRRLVRRYQQSQCISGLPTRPI
jgi:hypothetical protein